MPLPARALAALVSFAASASSQDMRGNCVGCGDEHRKCEFQCLLPSYRANTELAWPYSQPQKGVELSSCLTSCGKSRESCSEETESTNCLSCASKCASTYEAEMLACLQKVDATTTLTFGKNLDACSVASSSTHDSCAEKCHSEDAYYGWSPEAEEGLAVTTKFTIPGYRASLKQATSDAPAAAAADAARVTMEAPPTVATDFAARTKLDAQAGLGDQWVLAASGTLGVALFITGGVLERRQSARRAAWN